MKRYIVFVLVWLFLFTINAQTEPYKNKNLSPKERAEDLISRLTTEEKISLMMDNSPAIERLGIPKYTWWNEALHGVGRAGLATVLPQCIGLAATFDPEAIENAYGMVSDEARAKYNQFRKEGKHERYQGLSFWTPNVNIFRDPRWGRGQETYGEDPYLTTLMGLAVVKGLQGKSDTGHMKTLAGAKHYAVHSGPEWNRHSFNANNIFPEDLWGTYLPAFKALVDEGVGQVMCAYNQFDDEPCCSSEKLLTKILREEWGYDGIVVTDCWAMNDFFIPGHHETHKNGVDASAAAVWAGTDLECGPVFSNLNEALEQGLISEEKINRSLLRILSARFALGEMDELSDNEWADLPYSIVNSKPHQDIALDLARKSMTLLKNNGTLPLSKEDKSVVVMGPNANDSLMQWGNYNGVPSHTTTILEGIRNKIGDVDYIKGCDLVINNFKLNFYHEDVNQIASNLAAGKENNLSDVKIDLSDAELDSTLNGIETVIFVGGISPQYEGEEMPVTLPGFRGGDRESIELPLIQRDLIKRLKDMGKKIVLVNCSGSAVALAPEDTVCDAILQAWYPGEKGGEAVADVLFGDYNPAGRLPVTFYKNDSQLPDFEYYDMDGRTYRYMEEKPLYPFGYGLSYSDFSYENPSLPTKAKAGEPVIFSVDVTNTGKKDGDEVVQVYIKRVDEAKGPIKNLKGIKRINLAAGETKKVEIPLPAQTFEAFDPDTERMKLKPGDFKVFYGANSATEDFLTITLE